MCASKFIAAITLFFMATLAQAAGLRLIDIPASADGPALKGAMWYPCAEPSGEVNLGKITVPAVKDCPLLREKLPLVVVSHGRGGSFIGHHDTDEVLADAGFIVAAIVERPTDIKRLIDFLIGGSALASKIDQETLGFFGFSRGGYTGLVLVGANPDFASAAPLCQQSRAHFCEQILRKEFPAQPLTHDPRIKAAVIVDPLTIFFTADSFAAVKVPVQLWASERGGDGVLPHSVDLVDSNLPARHQYHVVPNAGHFAFLAPCPPALVTELAEICVDANGFDRVASHTQFDAAALAFFRTHLTNAQ